MTERARGFRVPRLPRIPAHVIVMLSATTAGYAATLAGVTANQAAGEAGLRTERDPLAADIAAVAAGHDDLADRLESWRAGYTTAADAYDHAAAILGALHDQLAGLASTVADIDGVSRNLPTSVRMPVPRTVVQVGTPSTHATTGASGG
jgi:hypothetical protein